MDTYDDWAPKHDHPALKRSGNILFLRFRNMFLEWLIFVNMAKGHSCANKVFLAKNSIETHSPSGKF
jgi:hypothetical protein